MADYSMIGSFSDGGASALNGDLITKLREAEEKAVIAPIDKSLETWDTELEKFGEIDTAVNELRSAVAAFNLFNSGNTAFDQISADTTGTSAVFDATDLGSLEEGITTVSVSQLAQKDVYQTDAYFSADTKIGAEVQTVAISGTATGEVSFLGETVEGSVDGDTAAQTVDRIIADKESIISTWNGNNGDAEIEDIVKLDSGTLKIVYKDTEGDVGVIASSSSNGIDFGESAEKVVGRVPEDDDALTINIDGSDFTFNTKGKTLTEVAAEININDKITASVEQVGDNSYRMIIKSTDSGTENKLTISQTGINLGDFAEDGDNHKLTAQNLNANIDGIDYDVSSSSITVGGNLKITATSIGDSTISIQKDTSYVIPALEDIVTKYNDLVTMVDKEIYSGDSSLQDLASMRTMLADMKNILFDSYGADDPEFGDQVDSNGDTVYAHSNVTNNDKNIFQFGFSFDKEGKLSLDKEIMGAALTDNMDDIKALFTGVAENKSIGTMLTEYIDDMHGSNGLLSMYGDNMTDRKTTLEKEKEKSNETLNAKYSLMSQQFIEYGAIISQMEASFAGLKQMMAESVSK